MSDDILKRLDDYSSEVADRINRGVVPFCHLGASVVGPMCKEAAARIRVLEAQIQMSFADGRDAEFNAGLRRGEI